VMSRMHCRHRLDGFFDMSGKAVIRQAWCR
jgi:hypothetical protein